MRVLLMPHSWAPFPWKLWRVLARPHSYAHSRRIHGFFASLWIPSERHQSGTLEIDTMTRRKRYLNLRLAWVGWWFLLSVAWFCRFIENYWVNYICTYSFGKKSKRRSPFDLFESCRVCWISLFLMKRLSKLVSFGGWMVLRMKLIAKKELNLLFQMTPSRILCDR